MLAKLHTVLVCTLGVVCLGGCGQADYEKGMEKTKARLDQAGKFSPLSLVPVVITDTPCQIRLPETFVNRSGIRFFAHAADGEGGPTLDDLRPPFLKLPELKLAYQTMGADDRGAQYPYFCYVAALPPGTVFTVPAAKPPAAEAKTDAPAEPQSDAPPENKPDAPAENKSDAPAEKRPDAPAEKNPFATDEKKPDAPVEKKPDAPAEKKPEAPAENKPEVSKEEPAEKPAEKPAAESTPENKPVELSVWIKDELTKAFPDQKEKIEWQPVEAPTPVLGQASIPWKRISVEGVQPFQFIGGSNSDFLEKVEGTFILYMCERDGTTVLVGWRIPKALEGKAPIEQWALLSAGTLRP